MATQITLKDLKELLIERYDECDLLDALGLTTQDIVKAFSSVIERKADYLISEMEILSEGYIDEEDMGYYEDGEDY